MQNPGNFMEEVTERKLELMCLEKCTEVIQETVYLLKASYHSSCSNQYMTYTAESQRKCKKGSSSKSSPAFLLVFDCESCKFLYFEHVALDRLLMVHCMTNIPCVYGQQ